MTEKGIIWGFVAGPLEMFTFSRRILRLPAFMYCVAYFVFPHAIYLKTSIDLAVAQSDNSLVLQREHKIRR